MQINNVHAIIIVRRLGSGAILLTLVNTALQTEHHLVLLKRESSLLVDRCEHILEKSA